MNRANIQFGAVLLTVLLLLAAAIGYLVSPAGMLSVVGIEATPTNEFLVRTLAAAFLAMIPSALSVRRRGASTSERTILAGLALYMFAGSAVDAHAYLSALVGSAAVPSIIFRSLLGLALAWLVLRD
jgi:hypothetical protein